MISDIVKGRQTSKKKSNKVTTLSATRLGLIRTEGQTFDAQSQLKQLRSQWVAERGKKRDPGCGPLHPTAPPAYEDKEGAVEVRGLYPSIATGTKVIIKGKLMKEDEKGEESTK